MKRRPKTALNTWQQNKNSLIFLKASKNEPSNAQFTTCATKNLRWTLCKTA